MGWFDDQIRQRKLTDNKVFEDSFKQIGDAVIGKRATGGFDESYYTKDSMEQILKYYGCKMEELPDGVNDFNDQLEYLCRNHGIMRRRIKLTPSFYKDAFGPILAFSKDEGKAIALIPGKISGYTFVYDGKVSKINKNNEVLFDEDAFCFYKPLPLRKITPLDLVKYALLTRSLNDNIVTVLLLAITTVIGLNIPNISYFLMSYVIEQKSINLLVTTLIYLLSLNISSIIFSTIKGIWDSRVNTKMSIDVQAATMMRVLSLPANFFRQYASGDLTTRVSYVSSLTDILMNAIFSTTLTSLFSLSYIYSIFEFAPTLVVPSLLIILATVVCSIISTIINTRRSLARMEYSSKEYGMSYAMVTGIQKIKLSGAEKRAFARWGNLYAKESDVTYRPEYISLVSTCISYLGTLALYYISIKANLTPATYYSFNTAYGMVSGAFMSFASIALTIANIKPTLTMAKPILDAEPEIGENKKVVTRIQGGIELNNVSFRYNDSMPFIIDNMSLKIKPGQYIAVVGKTGCGKSTLIRLLLGFEKPLKGAIYYDGKDINSLDLKSLRRKIGTVMQDGKLFMGDIFSNITISAPWLTMDEAWAAAEMSGIADDIRRMPMGMHTIISEGSGGISGGQRQRLLIARAIAPNPRILIFDEATSALDNITQRKVSESLDSLKCTRIVIAHRLSTIKNCDRILYLEDGKIIEDGTYDELIALNGKFADLVERQRLDK